MGNHKVDNHNGGVTHLSQTSESVKSSGPKMKETRAPQCSSQHCL